MPRRSAAPAPRIVHFQANENHRGFVGTGHIDWPAVARALAAVGYAGPISLEPFRRDDERLGVPLAQWRAPHEDEDARARRPASPICRRRSPSRRQPAMSTLRIGWIGCGTHASQMLLPQLIRFDVALAALCDTDAGAARRDRRSATALPPRTATRRLARAARARRPRCGRHGGRARRRMPRSAWRRSRAACRCSWRSRRRRPRRRPSGSPRPPSAPGVPVVVGFMKRYSTANRIAANIIAGAEFGHAARASSAST